MLNIQRSIPFLNYNRKRTLNSSNESKAQASFFTFSSFSVQWRKVMLNSLDEEMGSSVSLIGFACYNEQCYSY